MPAYVSSDRWADREGTPAPLGVCFIERSREAIFEVLGAVAPAFDRAGIVPDEPLREQVDLDSFDFLNVIIGVRERLGIEIPEADYGQLGTLDSMLDYLVRRSASAQAER